MTTIVVVRRQRFNVLEGIIGINVTEMRKHITVLNRRGANFNFKTDLTIC